MGSGAFGPAMTLIFNSKFFNLNTLSDLTESLKVNFMKLAEIKPTGKKAFCVLVHECNLIGKPLSPAEIVAQKFFQSMRKSESSPFHFKVLEFMISRMFEPVKSNFPEANKDFEKSEEVYEWTARFIECYISDEKIEEHCQLKDKAYEIAMKTYHHRHGTN